jgi:hypothetical protein
MTVPFRSGAIMDNFLLWRTRATEALARAEMLDNSLAKQRMLQMADRYLQMARRVEKWVTAKQSARRAGPMRVRVRAK